MTKKFIVDMSRVGNSERLTAQQIAEDLADLYGVSEDDIVVTVGHGPSIT